MLSPPLLQMEIRNSKSQDSLGEGLQRWGNSSLNKKENLRQSLKGAEFVSIPLFNHLVTEQSLK